MNIDICSFDDVHLLGETLRTRQYRARRAMRRYSSLRADSPLRPRALPGTPIAALASAFNCRF
jgi:hypothetical protein